MPTVSEQIIIGAKKEAAEILAKAEAEADAIEREAKAQEERKASEIMRAAEQAARDAKGRILSEARLSARQAAMARKQEMIDAVFSRARSQLSRVPLSKVLPKGASGSLRVAKRDFAWAKRNFPGEVSEAGILGGYILDSGEVVANNSFDLLLGELRGGFTAKILKAIERK
jgi:vacuolar-type H+-ATPase subunit E/Vma4